jgi:DNA-binding transcriptional ArsR family regulator
MASAEARDILAQWKAHSLAVETNSLTGPELAVRAAELFKVLSDPTRVRIIQALIENEETRVRDLAEMVGMSQSSVSHHLRILRHFRLVRTRREGKEAYYSPDDAHVELLLRVCVEHITSDH